MWRCWVLLVVVGCTKPNPEVCCLDPDDCASIGVSDPERTCAEGLACVNNACVVPSCSTDGCTARAPVCDITLDVCTACTGPADCDQFETKVCDTTSGACVECVTNADCTVAKPVCDASECRGCVLDSECDSGACGDDGACVDESQIIYLAPTGTDAGTCTRTAPCKLIEFAISNASILRPHIVFATGTYVEPSDVDITMATTPAPSLTFHGNGSTVSAAAEDVIGVTIPATFRDLTIINTSGTRALSTDSPQLLLERVTLEGKVGLSIADTVTARDLKVKAVFNAIELATGSSLDLDRATLEAGDVVVTSGASSNVSVLVRNTLIFGSDETGVRLLGTNGALEFVTITKVGLATTTNTAGLVCNPGIAIRSSIVWTPVAGKLPISGGCSLTNVLAGPTAVAGAESADPLFVNDGADDFHLGANSPARDAVNAGPMLDFEGDPRPQGDRFDIGADESP